MGVTNYYTIDGQMIGYKDANGRKDFLTDNLGSVTAEIDQTGTNRTFDGRYRPYGNSLWSTGTRGSFGWVGTWGYRGTGLNTSTHYMSARHYSQASGSWTSVDPYWPKESAFPYVNGRVAFEIDPSGTGPFKCERCASGLFPPYFMSPVHDCCHNYIHCLTCCILSHEFDADCAKNMQRLQNIAMNAGPDIAKGRMDACEHGISGNVETAKCGDHCAQVISNKDKSKNWQPCDPKLKPNGKSCKDLIKQYDMPYWPSGGHLPPDCYNASPLIKYAPGWLIGPHEGRCGDGSWFGLGG